MFSMLKKKKPYIKFHTSPILKDVIPHPVPSRKKMPDWFRKLKPKVTPTSNKGGVGTAKTCVPMVEANSQGFMMLLWADVNILVRYTYNLYNEEGDEIASDLFWPDDETLLLTEHPMKPHSIKKTENLQCRVYLPETTEDNVQNHTIRNHAWEQVGNACDLKKFQFGKQLMKFMSPWIIETSPGWSCQFKNPANSWANDITIIEGIVDTDTYYSEINLPFVYTGSEEVDVIIPRGTPIAQVIPFKREEVELIVGEADETKQKQVNLKLANGFVNRYRRMFWHKRDKEEGQ